MAFFRNMSPRLGIVICRQASDYLKPGFVLGYSCKICTKPLQVSPLAVNAMREGSLIPLCNECGFAMQKRLEDAGATIDIMFSAEATAQMEELVAQIRRQGANN